MGIFNDVSKCQSCGCELSCIENDRIKNEQTLRLCDYCWERAKLQIKKVAKLWKNLKLS